MKTIEFQQVDECRKCGSDDISLKYWGSQMTGHDRLVSTEHLELKCGECGYRAPMYCKDKQPRAPRSAQK